MQELVEQTEMPPKKLCAPDDSNRAVFPRELCLLHRVNDAGEHVILSDLDPFGPF